MIAFISDFTVIAAAPHAAFVIGLITQTIPWFKVGAYATSRLTCPQKKLRSGKASVLSAVVMVLGKINLRLALLGPVFLRYTKSAIAHFSACVNDRMNIWQVTQL